MASCSPRSPHKPAPGRRRLLLAITGLLGGCGEASPTFHATELRETRLGGDFAGKMRDFHGQPRNIADFHGKIVILFFGYTSCPDVCPSALAKYAALRQQPGLEREAIQVLFITLDPARDTPQHLAEYLAWFDTSFIGLSADQESTDDIAQRFRVTATRRVIPGNMGYVIDHTAGAYVFSRDGRLRLYLAENAKLAEITADIQHLLSEPAP